MLSSELFCRRTFRLSVKSKSEGKMKQVAAAVVVTAVIEWRWAAGKAIVRSWSVAGRGAALLMVWMLLDHHSGCCQYCQ